MDQARIKELEGLLAAANDALQKLTLANTDLTRQMAGAEMRNRKLKRNSRNDESAFKDQLTAAQNRRY